MKYTDSQLKEKLIGYMGFAPAVFTENERQETQKFFEQRDNERLEKTVADLVNAISAAAS